MTTLQIKFRPIDDVGAETDETLGGILITDDAGKEHIICGCCGGIFEPEKVNILERYSNWCDLCDDIMGD